MRKDYPSDISREAFEKIAPLLSSARKKTRPRTQDLYDVFCALLYLLKSGCQWDMIPADFPNKSTVYYYFKLWKARPSEDVPSLLEQALKKCGWRGPRKPWAERADHLHDYRCAEREKHGHGGAKGV